MTESSADQSQKKPATLNPEKLIAVLHVDDEAEFLKSSKQLLEMQGVFRVESASSVKEAKEKMEAKTFDVIVSDYIMPGKDGLEFLRELRESGNSIPFIVFTGKGREIVAIKALNLGADQYVNKIGNPETVYSELAHAIRTAVKAKKAEEEVRKSEAKYRGLVENIGNGIATIDLDGRYVFVNQALCDMVGYSEKELIGKRFAEFLHPDDKKRMLELFSDSGKDPNRRLSIEFRVLHKNGHTVHMHSSPTPTLYNNKIVGFNAILSDITERKRIEEALRKSELYLSKAQRAAHFGSWVLDVKTNRLEFSDELFDIFGINKEQFSGTLEYTQSLVKPEDRARVREYYEDLILRHKPVSMEYSIMRPDGSARHLWGNGEVEFDEKGDLQYLVGTVLDITERKEAEEELVRLASAAKMSTDGIMITDLTGKLLDANEATLKRYGTNNKGDLIGKTSLDFVVPEDREKVLVGVKEAFEKGYCKRLECHLIIKDGSKIPVEMSLAIIKAQDGKPVGFVSVTRDITERKCMEKALQDSEERFRQVAENSGEWIWEVDTNGLYTYASPVVEKIVGYNPEELVGKKHFYDMFRPEDREDLKNAAFQDFAEKSPFREFINRIMHKNGSTVWLSTSGVPIVDSEGTLIGYRGSDKDITEWKNAVEALQESERKHRLLTENITDVIYIQDMNLNVTYASPSVKKLSGYTPEELLKLRPDKFMTPESFERGVADFKEAIASSIEDPNYEIPIKQYEYVCKDGSTVWGELKMKMLRDSNNNLVAIQGTIRDITERKKAEKKMSQMMNELRAINEKLAVIGKLTRHDARNKLAVIANNVYLAKQKLAAIPDASDYFGEIESAIDQMETIFDFARTYEMLGVEELCYMDVERSVDEAAILFSALAAVKVVNACKGLTVRADSLLRQIFYNLVDDTLKHGEKVNQIKVYYKEEKDQLKLIYEDNGVGVAENEKEKVFEEGYGKGTGYGLYLITKICETYGWTIQETGVPGKGVQFIMTIPKINSKGETLYRFDNE
jgi:PAS domain S-box-containing protein